MIERKNRSLSWLGQRVIILQIQWEDNENMGKEASSVVQGQMYGNKSTQDIHKWDVDSTRNSYIIYVVTKTIKRLLRQIDATLHSNIMILDFRYDNIVIKNSTGSVLGPSIWRKNKKNNKE